MRNTKIPVLGTILFLLAVFSLSTPAAAVQVIPLEGLKNPTQLVVDGGQFFIADYPIVYIYSLADFSLLRKFGKEGKGPGEFEGGALYLKVLPDQVIVHSGWKSTFYTRQGGYIKEVKEDGVHPLGKNFIKVEQTTINETLYWNIDIRDADGKKINPVYSYMDFYQAKGPYQGAYIMDLLRQFRFFRAYGNRMILMDKEEFLLTVYDETGKKLNYITHLYERRKVKGEDKSRYFKFFKTSPTFKTFYTYNSRLFKFYLEFPAIRDFDFYKDLVYVFTYKEKDNRTELFVFDTGGKVIKQTYIPILHKNVLETGPFSFCDMKFYQLSENEKNAKWELRILDIK